MSEAAANGKCELQGYGPVQSWTLIGKEVSPDVISRNAMKTALAVLIFISFAFLSAFSQTPSASTSTLGARTAGLEKHDGFFPYYWDGKKGTILFELTPAALDREFIYFTGLGSGIGSTDLFADRSSVATANLCRLRRVGPRVLVIAENTNFRAENGSPDLKQSVAASFPTSVLAALPIEAEQDGNLLADANALLVRDAADLLSQLRHPLQAVGGQIVHQKPPQETNWRLDEARSVIDLDHSRNFPLNTEIEALLTFATDSENKLNEPDPHALSLREHHSFVALPSQGYESREWDPRVGFFGVDFQDFSQPFDRSLKRMLISRWRLQKKDPSASLSEPVKPLVFYLDPAIPEPIRSAARRGALWWNTAFEQAGFKNALRIEDLPSGADPLDIRYPTIQWTNRSGRGWSVGMAQVDPRTGEIIHAVVQLDSHRMRTANHYWEALVPAGRDREQALDSFAALDNLDPKVSDQQVMLNRIALLTCHEMGHVLGLEHNFVASTFGRGSVMDYYAPRVRIRRDGTPDLSDAYMQGVGSYDRFAIEWGYSEGHHVVAASQESSRLDGVIKKALSQGIFWGNFHDPRWNAYDDGPDPVTWLKEVLPVRDALLARYGPQLLRPGEPASNLSSRFALIYLFHRYALASAINVIGSARIPPSLAGDGQQPVTVWPAASQKEALNLALQALNPARLDIPPSLWRALAPADNGDEDRERFKSSADYVFSPQDGARAVAEVVLGGLLAPDRIERLAVIAHQTAGAPSPSDVISALVRTGFQSPPSNRAQTELQSVVQAEIAERLMALAADDQATPEVQSAALQGVEEMQKELHPRPAQSASARRLDREITLFLRDPHQNTPKPKPSGAPPGPPV